MENTTQKSTYNNLWSQIASPPATPDTQVQRPRIPAYSSFSSHHSRPHTNRRPQPQHNGVKSYFREHFDFHPSIEDVGTYCYQLSYQFPLP